MKINMQELYFNALAMYMNRKPRKSHIIIKRNTTLKNTLN